MLPLHTRPGSGLISVHSSIGTQVRWQLILIQLSAVKEAAQECAGRLHLLPLLHLLHLQHRLILVICNPRHYECPSFSSFVYQSFAGTPTTAQQAQLTRTRPTLHSKLPHSRVTRSSIHYSNSTNRIHLAAAAVAPNSSTNGNSGSSTTNSTPIPISIIATDVDGTLLNSQQQLTSGVEAAVRAAADAGVPVSNH